MRAPTALRLPATRPGSWLANAFIFVCLAAGASSSGLAQNIGLKGDATAAPTCPALLQHNFLRLQDEKPQPLCQYAGKVVVVVNTASFCGFTPQYETLEALHARYQARGLVVLGFPSNDFSQESGSNQEIAAFCDNTFGVKFPMFVKSSVRGSAANPFFKQLAERGGSAPKWNFHKYVLARDGSSVRSFDSAVSPGSPAFVGEIEKLLGQPMLKK